MTNHVRDRRRGVPARQIRMEETVEPNTLSLLRHDAFRSRPSRVHIAATPIVIPEVEKTQTIWKKKKTTEGN
ncbi:MAG: hypothetical protein U0X87_12905 [Anaerolineales bacterium]